jgi:hypothetical protein
MDLSKLIPRKIVYLFAKLLYKTLRIDYKNDIILYNELSIWLERNKNKWRCGLVECIKCEHRWVAVHLLKLTHIECPNCKEMSEYYEIDN